MSRGECTKKPSILEILSSLAKAVPVLKLERIETIYPVFEGKSICLSSGRRSVNNQLAENVEIKNAAALRENEGETDDDEEEEEQEEEEDEGDGDVLFEYEMDFEGVSRNMTFKTEIISEDDNTELAVDVVNEDALVGEERRNANKTEIISKDDDTQSAVLNEDALVGEEGGNTNKTEIISEEDLKKEPLDVVYEGTFKAEEEAEAKQVASDDTESNSLCDNVIEGNESLETQCESSTKFEPNCLTNISFEPGCESREKEVLDTSITKNGAEKRKWGSDETGVIVLDDSDLSGAEDANSPGTQSATWAKLDWISTKSALPETNIIEKVKSSAKRTKYSCRKCIQVFDTKVAFATHDCSRSLVSANIKEFLCPRCEKLFPNLTQLKQHIVFCWKGMMNCVICSKVAFGKFALIKHLQEHTDNASVRIKSKGKACLVCGSFDWNWDVRKHWHEHADATVIMDSNIPHIECSHCGRMLANEVQYENHKQVHSVTITYNMCESCGLFFEKGSDLEIHVLSHVNSNVVFKCTLCNKIYPFQLHFELHNRSCTRLPEVILRNKNTQLCLNNIYKNYLKVFNTFGIELAPCIEEIKTFRHLLRLQANELYDNVTIKLRKDHGDSLHALFSCQVCWNTFVGRESFRSHWREHTGYDPNKCMLCSQVFLTAMLCMAHVLKAHQHKYICTKCLFVFKTCKENKIHEIAHMQKAAYFCENCGAGFSEFNYFEYHVFTNHVKGCKGSLMLSLPRAAPPETDTSNLNEDKCNSASSSESSSSIKCISSTASVANETSSPCKPKSEPTSNLSDDAVNLNPKIVRVQANCRVLDFHPAENDTVTVTNNLRMGAKPSSSNQQHMSTTSINSTVSNSHSKNDVNLQYSVMSTTSNAAPVVTLTTASVPNHAIANTCGRNAVNSQYSVMSTTSNAAPVVTLTTASVPNHAIANTCGRNDVNLQYSVMSTTSNAAPVVTLTTASVPNHAIANTCGRNAVNSQYSVMSFNSDAPPVVAVTSSVPNYSISNPCGRNAVNSQYPVMSTSNAASVATPTTSSVPNYTVANHYSRNSVNSQYSVMSSTSNAAQVATTITSIPDRTTTTNPHKRNALNSEYSIMSSASNASPVVATITSVPNHSRTNPHNRNAENSQYSVMSSTSDATPAIVATTSSAPNHTIVNHYVGNAVNSQYSVMPSASNMPVAATIISVPNHPRRNPHSRSTVSLQYSVMSSTSNSAPVVSATTTSSVKNHTIVNPQNRNAANLQYSMVSSASNNVPVAVTITSAPSLTRTNPHSRNAVNSQYSVVSSALNAAPVAASITSAPNCAKTNPHSRNAVNLRYSVMSSASNAVPVVVTISSAPIHAKTNPHTRNAVNSQYTIISSASNVAPVVATISSVPNLARTNPYIRNAVNSQYAVKSSASNAAPVVATITSVPNLTRTIPHNKSVMNSQYAVMSSASNSVPVVSTTTSAVSKHTKVNPHSASAVNFQPSVSNPVTVNASTVPNHVIANVHGGMTVNLQNSVSSSIVKSEPVKDIISSAPNWSVVAIPGNTPGVTPMAQVMTMNSVLSYSVAVPYFYKCDTCSATSQDLLAMIQHAQTHQIL